jgi:hypothetical protein
MSLYRFVPAVLLAVLCANVAADDIVARDFGFLAGDWNVHHRRMLPETGEWAEFEGTCRNRLLMEGDAIMDDCWLNDPRRAYHAVALRALDPKTRLWSIWWLDGRYPTGPVGPPMRGGFEDGVGTFYNDYEQSGKPMRGRFVWSQITSSSAQWEQATSADGGKTWDTNWIMKFSRAATLRGHTDNGAERPRDFQFLQGDWRVSHRYLRATPQGNAWTDAVGTCSHRPAMDGWANVEEYRFDAPSGSYRAVGLRSYDASNGQWFVWWLDGRDPSATLDPPMQGKFANGGATFYGQIEIKGHPTRVRFQWSPLPSAPRWEQAYSADDGKTWETNWIMQFSRAPAPGG